MDFPLLNAALASVNNADCSTFEPKDISGLKVAVQEPSLKYREFDNLGALPDVRLSSVANHTKENEINSLLKPEVMNKDIMEGLSDPLRKQIFSRVTFNPKLSPNRPVSGEVKRHSDVKKKSLREVFAFLDGKPSSDLRDIFC